MYGSAKTGGATRNKDVTSKIVTKATANDLIENLQRIQMLHLLVIKKNPNLKLTHKTCFEQHKHKIYTLTTSFN
jgi:hypothetical protein